MFDMLTRDDLYNLHTSLFGTHTKLHRRILDANLNPLVSPLGEDWAVISAAMCEVAETMRATMAEIGRREQMAQAGSPILDVPRA